MATDERIIYLPEVAGTRSPSVDSGPPRDRLLHHVALALNSTLELGDVLRRLADLALETTDAQRCSLFLLDGTRLTPTVAVGRRPDSTLWARFRGMPPIELTDVPDGLRKMADLRAVAVHDASASPLIPPEWVERFGLGSLVVVPLHAAGDHCGLMVLDHPTRTFEPDELEVLEDLAAYAGTAVRNARTFEAARRHAQVQEALVQGASALTADTGQAHLGEVLVDAYTRLLGATACAIGLFDPQHRRITALAGSVERDFPVSEVPAAVSSQLTSAWAERLRPVAFGPHPWFASLLEVSSDRHLALPLAVDGQVRGAILLAYEGDRPDDEDRSACWSLATMASAVLERGSLTQQLEQQLRRMQVLHAVSAGLVEGADAPELVARVDGLLAGQGLHALALSLRDPRQAGALGADPPLPAERHLRTSTPVELDGDVVAVPLLVDDRVVGTLRVRPAALALDEQAFLETIGRGIAEVIERGGLRASVRDLDRDRSLAVTRDLITIDLHDSMREAFVAIGLLARNDLERLPPDSPFAATLQRIANLSATGKWEIDQAQRALANAPGGDRTLVVALGGLTEAFHRDSGIRVLVDAEDAPTGPEGDRILFRVAHEALQNAWRHGRCAIVHLSLQHEGDRLVLRVRDDGVGLGRHSGNRIAGLGLTTLRRLLDRVGGDLELTNAQPRGALLTASVPVGAP